MPWSRNGRAIPLLPLWAVGPVQSLSACTRVHKKKYIYRGKAMANYPQELAQDSVCQSHTGHMTGLWFLPTRPLRLNTNEWMNEWIYIYIYIHFILSSKIMYFNAWEWSVQLKHVACIDKNYATRCDWQQDIRQCSHEIIQRFELSLCHEATALSFAAVHPVSQNDRQSTCNVTLRRILAIIAAVGQQWVLHILSVWF